MKFVTPPVLHDESKVEPKTSKMGLIPITF